MSRPAALTARARDATLWWCVAGSALAHALLLHWLPGWQRMIEQPQLPLTVELRETPPQIVLPQPLPMETRPVVQERPKPPVKPEPLKAAQREERAPEPPTLAPASPLLTAPLEAPSAPQAPVVEQRPAPPPPPAPEPPRAAPAPPAPPAPFTPPRSDAAYLNNPRPAYPLAARRRGDHGTVLVRVLVTAEGLAASVALEKSSGHPSLDEAALSAVKSWRFMPARQGGQAIESPYVVPIVFKLDQ